MGKLLTCKELAWELNKNVNYVYAMRASGFLMPGDVATIDSAIEWLGRNPNFSKRKAWPKNQDGKEPVLEGLG